MAETSISVNEMAKLQNEINQEIQEVKSVLKQVNKCCDKNPADEDTILSAIEKTGKELNTAWDNLFRTFESAGNDMGNLIQKYASAVQQKTADVENMKKGL